LTVRELPALFEISQILNCGLDKHSLNILVTLCEAGLNPEALAAIVKEIKKESEAYKVRPQSGTNGKNAGLGH
jgi:mitotic-spindle organizing protein 1